MDTLWGNGGASLRLLFFYHFHFLSYSKHYSTWPNVRARLFFHTFMSFLIQSKTTFFIYILPNKSIKTHMFLL